MDIPKILISAAVGAGLMYVIDPKAGRRRRALMRDQAVHMAHEAEEAVDTAGSKARHARNKAKGAVTETKGLVEDQIEKVSNDKRTPQPTGSGQGRRRRSSTN